MSVEGERILVWLEVRCRVDVSFSKERIKRPSAVCAAFSQIPDFEIMCRVSKSTKLRRQGWQHLSDSERCGGSTAEHLHKVGGCFMLSCTEGQIHALIVALHAAQLSNTCKSLEQSERS
jgi:hypothetical protein